MYFSNHHFNGLHGKEPPIVVDSYSSSVDEGSSLDNSQNENSDIDDAQVNLVEILTDINIKKLEF